MDTSALESNFEAIFKDTLGRRVAGKAPEQFILQCILKTPHSFEQFKINVKDFITKLDAKRGKGATVETEAQADADETFDKEEKQSATA